MVSKEPSPFAENHAPETASHGPGIVELGTASQETRGAIGFLKDYIGQFIVDGIDRD